MQKELAISPLEESFTMGFTDMDELLDFIEFRMVELGDLIDTEVKHRFTKGLYTREFFGPAQSLVTSLKHKTEHQFIVSKGACAVFTEGRGWEIIEAPFHGLTVPGTRRLLYFFTDTVWTTMHVTDKTNVSEIESDIIDKRDNMFIKKALES